MKLIVVANSKGGSGKSLLVIGMASALHRAGKTVRLIDLDEQGTVSGWFDPNDQGIYQVPPETEFKIESGAFSKNEKENARLAYEHLLRVEEEGGYDFAIVDTKGEAATLTSIAMSVADLVICPTDASSVEYEPVILTYKSYEAVLKKIDSSLNAMDNFHVVLTRQPNFMSTAASETRNSLAEIFHCVTGPGQSSAYNEAHHRGATIGALMTLAERAATDGETPAIRNGAKRAVERYQKAFTALNDTLLGLGLLDKGE